MVKVQDHKMEMLCWWILLFMIYLMLLSSLSTVEIVVGAAVAALASVAAVRARNAEQIAFKLRLHWWRWWPALLADIVIDTVTLTVLLMRCLGGASAAQGRNYRIEFPPEPDSRAARSRCAIATALLSMTPGSYVLDSRDGENGADVLTIHCVSGRGRLAKVMQR